MTNQILSSDVIVELSAQEQQQLAGGACGGGWGCPGYGHGGHGGWGRRRRFGGWGRRHHKYGQHGC